MQFFLLCLVIHLACTSFDPVNRGEVKLIFCLHFYDIACIYARRDDASVVPGLWLICCFGMFIAGSLWSGGALCVRLWGRSSAGLECRLVTPKVASSNLVVPARCLVF